MVTVAWYVYIVRCADGTLYTGVTTNVIRRVSEHNGHGQAGAKYTKARRPVILAYEESAPNRAVAQQREAALRRMTRTAKLELIAGYQVDKS